MKRKTRTRRKFRRVRQKKRSKSSFKTRVRRTILSLAESKSVAESGALFQDTLPNPSTHSTICLLAAQTQGTASNNRIGLKVAVLGIRIQCAVFNPSFADYVQTLRIEIIHSNRRENPIDQYFLGNDPNRTPIAYDTPTIAPYLRHVQTVNTNGMKRLWSRTYMIAPTNGLGLAPRSLNFSRFIRFKRPIILTFEPNDVYPKPQLWCVSTVANPVVNVTTPSRIQGIVSARTYFKDM